MDKIKRPIKTVIESIYIVCMIAIRLIKLALLTQLFCKNIYIKSWFARLGNNLIQIAHAEMVSQKYGLSLYLPKHNFLRVEEKYQVHQIKDLGLGSKGGYILTKTGIFSDLQNQSENFISSTSSLVRRFYFNYDMYPLGYKLTDYRTTFKTKVLPLIPYEQDNSISDETLVIHIRSGDIFNNKPKPHPGYPQPPLSFYRKIIEKLNPTNIVIVTQEDLKNPCINQIQQLYSEKTRIQSLSLSEDINTILSARNLIVSFSTFSLSLAFASNRIQNLFIPQFDTNKTYWETKFWPMLVKLTLLDHNSNYDDISKLDLNLYRFKIKNYIPVGGWKNNQKQLNLMLQHSDEYITVNNL